MTPFSAIGDDYAPGGGVALTYFFSLNVRIEAEGSLGTRFMLDRMDLVHPGTREHFEASAFHSWITDPWARGASAAFGPDQLSRHYAALRQPGVRRRIAPREASG